MPKRVKSLNFNNSGTKYAYAKFKIKEIRAIINDRSAIKNTCNLYSFETLGNFLHEIFNKITNSLSPFSIIKFTKNILNTISIIAIAHSCLECARRNSYSIIRSPLNSMFDKNGLFKYWNLNLISSLNINVPDFAIGLIWIACGSIYIYGLRFIDYYIYNSSNTKIKKNIKQLLNNAPRLKNDINDINNNFIKYKCILEKRSYPLYRNTLICILICILKSISYLTSSTDFVNIYIIDTITIGIAMHTWWLLYRYKNTILSEKFYFDEFLNNLTVLSNKIKLLEKS